MSFADPVSSIIVQTGTDTDLTGLNGVAGVSVTTFQGFVAYDLSVGISLQIDGTLTINGSDTGDRELLLVYQTAANHTFPLIHVNSGTLNIGHKSSQTSPVTEFSQERYWPSIMECFTGNFDDGQGLNAPTSGNVCPFLGVDQNGTLNWYGCLNFTTGLFFEGVGNGAGADSTILIDGGIADCRRTTERGALGDNYLYNYSEALTCLEWTILSNDADGLGVSVLVVAEPLAFDNFTTFFSEEGAGTSISSASTLNFTLRNYNGVFGRSANRDWRSSGAASNTMLITFLNGTKGSLLNIEAEANPSEELRIENEVRGTLKDSAGVDRVDAAMGGVDLNDLLYEDTITAGAFDLGQLRMASIDDTISYTFFNPSDTDDDLWDFYVYSYLGRDTFAQNALLRVNDGLVIAFTAPDDLKIAESVIATVNAYTDIRDVDRLYDRSKSFKIANMSIPSIELPMALSDGNIVDLGVLDLIIDGDIGTAYIHAAGVITINPSFTIALNRIGATETVVDPEDDEITLAFPGGILDNDIAYLIIGHAESEDNTWNTPSGWAVIVTEQQTGGTPDSVPGLTVFRRVLSGDSGSVVVTNAGSNISGIVGQMIVYRFGDTVSPEDATTTLASGASGDPDPASITTNNANSVVLAIALGDAEQTVDGNPAGYTGILDTMTPVGGDEGGGGGAPTVNTYTFDALDDGDNEAFTFTGPQAGTTAQVANTAGRWCHDVDETTSADVGPYHGEATQPGGGNDGYLYTEMSSQASGDVWTMEWDTTMDAENNTWEFDFWWCARGDEAQPLIEVETNENGAGWVVRLTTGDVDNTTRAGGDETIPATNATEGANTPWFNKTIDLTGLISHASTRIRIRVQCDTEGDTGLFWHNDIGFDTIVITQNPIGGSLDGCVMATADKLVVSAGADNPATFDFELSEEWATATIAVKLAAGGDILNFGIGNKFSGFRTSGAVTVRDGATINGNSSTAPMLIEAGTIDLDDVEDMSNTVITGDLHINTAGTYNFANVTVIGDILNDDAGGNVQINASLGSSLSTSEPGTGNGQVNIVQTVPITVTVLDKTDDSPIEFAHVHLVLISDYSTEVLSAATNASGVVTDNYNFAGNVDIEGWARNVDFVDDDYRPENITGTITSSGFTLTVRLTPTS